MAKRKHRKGNQRPLKKSNPAMRTTPKPAPLAAEAQRIAPTPQPAATLEAQSVGQEHTVI